MDENYVKRMMLINDMNEGDIFSFNHNGKIMKATFIRAKSKNVLALIDNQQYNVPKSFIIEVLEKGNAKPVFNIDLKKGELFYIKKSDNAILYEFVRMTGSMIIGKNVLFGGEIPIDKSLFAGSVKQYQKEQKSKVV